jgi:surfeit locus 1 family protein
VSVADKGAGGWRSLIGAGIATLVAFAILVGLGIWQLERKTWKEGLIAQIEARAYGPPGDIVPESGWPAWRAAADEFRHVRLTGTLLHDRSVPLHGLAMIRGQAAPGFYIFTPLLLPDGATVMINRGIVPPDLRDRSRRAEGDPAGPVTVVGLVRAPEPRGAFVPANDPARDEWFVRDLGEMTAARSLNRVAPFYIDADATPNPGGWPLGGQTRLTLPNDHLNYAITWFGLALTLLGVFGAFAWRRLRGREPGPTEDGTGPLFRVGYHMHTSRVEAPSES